MEKFYLKKQKNHRVPLETFVSQLGWIDSTIRGCAQRTYKKTFNSVVVTINLWKVKDRTWTVNVHFRHPEKGPLNFYRKEVLRKEVEDIFEYPLVTTGKEYAIQMRAE